MNPTYWVLNRVERGGATKFRARLGTLVRQVIECGDRLGPDRDDEEAAVADGAASGLPRWDQDVVTRYEKIDKIRFKGD